MFPYGTFHHQVTDLKIAPGVGKKPFLLTSATWCSGLNNNPKVNILSLSKEKSYSEIKLHHKRWYKNKQQYEQIKTIQIFVTNQSMQQQFPLNKKIESESTYTTST